MEPAAASERPRLNLKPRTLPVGAEDPQNASDGSKSTVFGAARPREAVIAARAGVKEDELIKELAAKEWQNNIRLTKAQEEEKAALENDIQLSKDKLENDSVLAGSGGAGALQAEISLKEKKLEDLLKSFEEMALKQAKEGGLRRDRSREFEQNTRGNPNVQNQQGFGRGYSNAAEDAAFGAQFGGGNSQGYNPGYTNRRGGYAGAGGRSSPPQGIIDGRGVGRGRGGFDNRNNQGYNNRGGGAPMGRGGNHYNNFDNNGRHQQGGYHNNREGNNNYTPQQGHDNVGGGRGRGGGEFFDNFNQRPNQGYNQGHNHGHDGGMQRSGGRGFNNYNNHNGRGGGYDNRGGAHDNGGHHGGNRGYGHNNNYNNNSFNNQPLSPGSLSQMYDRGGSFSDLMAEDQPKPHAAMGNHHGGYNNRAGGQHYGGGGRGNHGENYNYNNQGYSDGRGRGGRGRGRGGRGGGGYDNYHSRGSADLMHFPQSGDQYGDR